MNTLDYYNNNAESYFNSTINADMSKSYEQFLKYVHDGKILDLGCGSGRDSLYFKNLGFDVTAIDGSFELCRLARNLTGLDVKCMKFEDIDYIDYFDGIWASASLLHIDRKSLIEVLKKTRTALKNSGYMYVALKNGEGEEVTKEGRFFSYYTYDDFKRLSDMVDLEIIDFISNKSVSNPNEIRYWNNYILKKK